MLIKRLRENAVLTIAPTGTANEPCPEVIKFMLDSAEYEIFLLINVKIPRFPAHKC